MNGTAATGSGTPGTVSNDWSIQGVGDFNGGGNADILWRNTTTGQVYIWLMNGTAIASAGTPGTVTNDWSIQGVGDFNGGGMDDIAWRNTTTGQVYIWLMNGTAIATSGTPGTVAAEWRIDPQSPYRCPDSIVCDVVTAQNGVRAVGPFGASNRVPNPALPALTWSVGAARVAQAWAANCQYGHNANQGPYGENIYATTGTPTAADIVTATPALTSFSWASEVEWYTLGTNTDSCAAPTGRSCGHYTQIVWRNTTAVGCAVQSCPAGSGPAFTGGNAWTFAVCDYDPPGNFTGQVPY
jgi:hypothetical protein